MDKENVVYNSCLQGPGIMSECQLGVPIPQLLSQPPVTAFWGTADADPSVGIATCHMGEWNGALQF